MNTAPALPDRRYGLRRMQSPVGRIEVVGDGTAITSLAIEHAGHLPHDGAPEAADAVVDAAIEQLEQYFAGSRRDFDLPVRLPGTPFQQQVWGVLQRVGWGETTSYGQLGHAMGRPTASRPVGGAVGRNPIPIIIGCHRVLGAKGAMTGYSAGAGISTKIWLLDHEGIGHAG